MQTNSIRRGSTRRVICYQDKILIPGLFGCWDTLTTRKNPYCLNVADFTSRKLDRGDFYIWENGSRSTLITPSGRTNHGIRISAVYALPKYRGRRYASAVVVATSQKYARCRNTVDYACAEIDDPAEQVYQRIGIEIIGSKISIFFRGCPSTEKTQFN